jgi:site-specific recombinase XerC
VVRLLGLHKDDSLEEDLTSEDKADLPLMRNLHASVVQWSRGQGGELVVGAKNETAGTAMSAAGIYAVLKRFFRQAAKTAEAVGLDARRFEKATHWMCHTFVRQALMDGVPVEVASELAGHASIDTTSIYSMQELARKIKAVHGMKRRVLW